MIEGDSSIDESWWKLFIVVVSQTLALLITRLTWNSGEEGRVKRQGEGVFCEPKLL